MNTAEFLRRIWPASGLYVIARLTGKGFRHQVCDTIDEAAAYALQFDAQGVATYHACAAFREREVEDRRADGATWKRVRTHSNVRALRAFFMDLDVEPGNAAKFASQEEALGGLVEFCGETGLPVPMVVSSGGGVHIYWTLANEILPEAWKPVAAALKQLASRYGFRADPACTADPARVLRPVGTVNRKTAPGRAVEIIAGAAPLEFSQFRNGVLQALKRAGLKQPEARPVVAAVETINQDFAVQHDFPPCSGEKVATRCAQLARMRDTRGCIAEPHWYACIQLLCHAVEGDALVHRWSDGYAGYTAEETDRKIAQIRVQGLGPTLCSTFEGRNPDDCKGCPFKGKISSPVQLGTHIAAAPPPRVEVVVDDQPTQVVLPSPPAPFTRGEKGGIFIEEDGITHQIYEYDLFPTELAFDEQLGYETVRMRHYLPQEGWKEFVLRSSLLARPVDFEIALRDQHVQPLIRNKITMFADAYMRKLRAETKMRKLFMTQGWKEGDTEFVLGTRLYRSGEVVTAGHSSGATGFVRHFRPQGTLEEWREPTFALGLPGMEPHAFMLLLAFAAPLLKLANRHGFTVCALGEKGVGKSTMGNWLASVYGHPEATWGAADDSVNARYERLGAYGALPMYFDEASTIEPDELRRLVYSVAAGKSRDTLKTDRTLRPGPTWETILITSSNDSLQAKLRLSKRNAEAEAARLFEFHMPRVRAFGEIANVIMPHLRANYGVAGPRYIQHVVNNLARVKGEANQRVLDSHRTLGIAPEDRFWAQAAALSIYGGELAREAGVIDFDPNCIRPWLIGELYRMKGNVVDNRTDAVAVLSQYLNEHVGERLVVTDLNRGLSVSDQKPTRGMLSQRYEPDKKLIWVDREHVRRWMDKHHFGADGIRDDLIKAGVLLADNAACSLGKGTYYAGGAVKCWKIRADHPGLDIATDEA